jgi:hypothetical protein
MPRPKTHKDLYKWANIIKLTAIVLRRSASEVVIAVSAGHRRKRNLVPPVKFVDPLARYADRGQSTFNAQRDKESYRLVVVPEGFESIEITVIIAVQNMFNIRIAGN